MLYYSKHCICTQVDEDSWNKALRSQVFRMKWPFPLPKLLKAPFKRYAPLGPMLLVCMHEFCEFCGSVLPYNLHEIFGCPNHNNVPL